MAPASKSPGKWEREGRGVTQETERWVPISRARPLSGSETRAGVRAGVRAEVRAEVCWTELGRMSQSGSAVWASWRALLEHDGASPLAHWWRLHLPINAGDTG